MGRKFLFVFDVICLAFLAWWVLNPKDGWIHTGVDWVLLLVFLGVMGGLNAVLMLWVLKKKRKSDTRSGL